jgi:Flp pilus assembly protein TadG
MVKVVKTKFRNLFLLVGGFILLILFLQCFKIIEKFAVVETTEAKEAKAAAEKAAAEEAAKAAVVKAAAEKGLKSSKASAAKAPTATKTLSGTITCMKGKVKTTIKGKLTTLKCPAGYSKV